MAEVLVHHKKSGGHWVVNTGRSLWHVREGLEMFDAPLAPDFLVTNESVIFHRAPGGEWVPELGWNETCHRRHGELFGRANGLFDRIRSLAARHSGINLAEENGQLSGVITANEEVMEEFVAFLEAEKHGVAEFSYQRNSVYLRFAHSDYHKGSALGELCRILQLGHHEVLAAGDHFNDISMLDGRFAAFPCCPSNAIPEVRATVQAAAGYIASQPAADGVAESWHFFHTSPRP